MPQIFHPSTNSLSKISIMAGGLVAVGTLVLIMGFHRSPYQTGVNVSVEQPVPFSHRHHVGGLGIDCRYCHTSVEESAKAGIPATKVCMSCHSQIWTEAPTLEPVRASYREDSSIPWVRVHDLPDFAYFDHSIHIKKGVGCTTCHGQVNEMALIRKAAPLSMAWCLDCHRNPEQNLRPADQIFNVDWRPPANQSELGRELAQKNNIHPPTHCSACHR